MRTSPIFVATVLSLLAALPAGAQTLPRLTLQSSLLTAAQDDLLDDSGDDAAPVAAEPADVAAPGAANVTASGAVGFVRPKGFYTSSDLGGFLRFGGWSTGGDCPAATNCAPRSYSNLQPYIGLAVGYDVLDFLAVQVSFGTGFIANAAPSQSAGSPRDHGITFVNLAVIGSYYFTGVEYLERFGIVAKLFGGGSFVNPAPIPEGSPFGGNVGGGVGVRWATLLTDVTIGLDVNGYAVFVPEGSNTLVIPAMSFAPILQYTF